MINEAMASGFTARYEPANHAMALVNATDPQLGTCGKGLSQTGSKLRRAGDSPLNPDWSIPPWLA
jgi:hypothetical protein